MTNVHVRAVAWLVGSMGLAALCSCRDEPPPPDYDENMGDASRVLAPTPVNHYYLPEKLVTGRAELQPLDFNRTPEAAAAADSSAPKSATTTPPVATPIPIPQPTTPDFPETTKGVQELIAALNKAGAAGDPNALVDFFVEDQRPDIQQSYKLALAAVEKLDKLVAAVEKVDPAGGLQLKTTLATIIPRDQMFRMHVISITPESDIRAKGVMLGLSGKEDVRFRKIDGRWYVDPNAAKLLETTRQSMNKMKPLDEIIDGLNAGAMDAATAGQKLMQWANAMAQPGATSPDATPPAGAPKPDQPPSGQEPPKPTP